MGQDKSFLEVEWLGASVLLWERQISVLKATVPEEIFISGPPKKGYGESVVVLPDEWEGRGPLQGIGTCLTQMRTDLLLVVAIDLGRIQPEFLQRLVGRSTRYCGIVPFRENRFEPLAAVYPAAAVDVALEQLKAGEYLLQRFVRRLSSEGLIKSYNVQATEQVELTNWNTPEDLERS